jgi:hypothetical protein
MAFRHRAVRGRERPSHRPCHPIRTRGRGGRVNVTIQDTRRSGGTSTQRPPPAAGFFITHRPNLATIRTIGCLTPRRPRLASGCYRHNRANTGLRNTDMDPTTPTNPGSAMSQGGTFIRPGAVGWGYQGPAPRPSRAATTPAAIEHALAAAAKDPDRVTDLLDELSRGRLWLPLPDDERPVTDGSAVLLPTVTYLGAEFVPAFTSAERLTAWPSGQVRRTGVPGPAACRTTPAGSQETARSPPCRTSWSRPPTWPGGCRPAFGIALNPDARPACPSTPRASVTWPRRVVHRRRSGPDRPAARPTRSRC